MRYILDTNFFIDAHRLHLPVEENPDFWKWLADLAENGIISIPLLVHDEICKGNDALAAWLDAHKKKIVDEYAAFSQIQNVMQNGYGAVDQPTLDKLKADPWVIAHALAVGGKVVTGEKLGNQTAPHNKKIPSVCATLSVPHLTMTAFMWEVRKTMPK